MEHKQCPFCGEEIAASAKKCRFCGEWLEEASTTENSETQPVPVTPVQPQFVERQNTVVEEYEVLPENPSFFQAYFVNPYFRRYSDFSGYTNRKSFWLTFVAASIVNLGLFGTFLLLSSFGFGGMICGLVIIGLVSLALIVPGVALAIRRLRDADSSPWSILWALIPVIGGIILLILFCKESRYEDTEEEGRWRLPDWIVAGVCAVLLILGGFLCLKNLNSLLNNGFDYDFSSWEDSELLLDDDYSSNSYSSTGYSSNNYSSDDYYSDEDDEEEYYEYIDEPEPEPENEPIEIKSRNAFEGYKHEFHGKIDNKYSVNMHLDLENYIGSYYYFSSSGGRLDLDIVAFNPDTRKIEILERNEKGEKTGYFDGYLTYNGILYGTFTNYKGKKMPFRLEVYDAP